MSDLSTPAQRLRHRLLDACLARAPLDGWTRHMIDQAAIDAGLSQGERLLAAPSHVIDVLDAFAQKLDADMVARVDLEQITGVRARVSALILARLAAMDGHREAVRRAVGVLSLQPGTMLRHIGATADLIWRTLKDPSVDGNFWSKRVILSGAMATIYAYWLAQDDDLEARTAFVRRRLDDIMVFEKAKAKLRPLSGAAQSGVKVLSDIRYGSR